MGLRMGNSISPCFFCFWRGGVGQAIINSFITYTGQCPPILTSCNAECSYVLFHDQPECVQEVKVKSNFTLPLVRVCHHYHYKLWSRSSYSVSVCLLCLGAHAQRRHTVVCWCFCHSVCYQDNGSMRAVQVLKHAQTGTMPCLSDLNWLDFWDKAWFSMYS